MARWAFAAIGRGAISLLLLLVGTLVATSCAMQSTGRAPRSTGMGRQANPVDISSFGLKEVEGRLERVEGDTLIIRGNDGEHRVHTGPGTAIFLEGGKGDLADLQEGLPVRASFSEDAEEPVLHWIEVPRPEDAQQAGKRFEKAGTEVAR